MHWGMVLLGGGFGEADSEGDGGRGVVGVVGDRDGHMDIGGEGTRRGRGTCTCTRMRPGCKDSVFASLCNGLLTYYLGSVYMARGALFGRIIPFLPLKPLNYQLIYAAHHLYPSFLYIQGFEGTVRLLSTTRGQSGKGQNLTLGWAWSEARARGESIPSVLADSSTIWCILITLSHSGLALFLWLDSPEMRNEYSCIVHFISPITHLPLKLLHQIVLIIVENTSDPPSTLMLVCKHWHAIVTSFWASLNLGTWSPVGAVTSKLDRKESMGLGYRGGYRL